LSLIQGVVNHKVLNNPLFELITVQFVRPI